MTRCKVWCGFKDERSKALYFNAVYTGSEENKQFFSATPAAQFILNVVNEDAFNKFKQGAEYYVDFTEAASS